MGQQLSVVKTQLANTNSNVNLAMLDTVDALDHLARAEFKEFLLRTRVKLQIINPPLSQNLVSIFEFTFVTLPDAEHIKRQILAHGAQYVGPHTSNWIAKTIESCLIKSLVEISEGQGERKATREAWALTRGTDGTVWRTDIMTFSYVLRSSWISNLVQNFGDSIHGVAVVLSPAQPGDLDRNVLAAAVQRAFADIADISADELRGVLEELDPAGRGLGA